MNLEQGSAWSVPEGNDPFYQPIFFYLRDLQMPGVYAVGEYWWSLLDYEKPLEMSLEYYSPEFTNDVIDAKQIDGEMLKEMDTIIQSLIIN
jgi:hypothetical protein